jgi:cell division protein ZapA (FtsZ GTPase activity inhibitor)
MESAVRESDKDTYEVSIAGLPLKLRSSYDEETVKGLVQVVDKKVKEVLEANPQISFQKAILLTSLHFVEEDMLLKKALFTELNSLEAKTKDLLNDLESSPVPRLRLDN